MTPLPVDRPHRSHWLLAALVVAAAAAPVRSDDLNGFLELRYGDADQQEEIPGVGTQDTEVNAIDRRLYFLYNRQAYPRLRFWFGGTFDDIDSTTHTDDERIDVDEQRLRPYAGIGQTTRRWRTQLSWNRDQRNTQREGFPELKTIRDGYYATVSFSPEEESMVRGRLQASRVYDYDADKLFRDLVRDTADLALSQWVTPHLRWLYRGTLNSLEDDLSGSDSKATSHRGQVTYNNAWFDRRVQFDSLFTVNLRQDTVEGSGRGEVELPLVAFEGLSARDDMPLLITLGPEPGLIDDDVSTPTPINLGLPPPAGDNRPWAMGVDLGRPLTVNTLIVWIDPNLDLPPAIASTYSWAIYSSPNDRDWTPRGVVAPAVYDEFLHRFTVRFDDVQTRYVKLVVPPLEPTVPDATMYPDVFVTELDAFERVAAPDNRIELSETFERLILNTRARLLANRDFYYEGSIDATWNSDIPTRYNNRHGLYYGQPLSREAQLTARIAWEQYDRGYGKDTALVYTAALVVTPVERVQYTASITGRDQNTVDQTGGDTLGALFYGRARLWEGVYLQLGVGRNYVEDPQGNDLGATSINFNARIEPRSDLIVNVLYDDQTNDSPTLSAGIVELFTRRGELNVTYTPMPTVYLYGQYREEWRSGTEPDTIRRLVASWAPFPSATFRLGLNYDETWRTLNDQRILVAGPFLRWNFNANSWAQFAYTVAKDDSTLRNLDNQVVSAILRWGF